ncbi:MAG: SHOCT domain-containing protein [Betaproteobacteria bacterium]|nr:SHOCT domain-containing protein [Betaproteobacteria bacterium]
MKTSFLAAALLLPLAVLAQPAPLLTATDPEGDDVGDGSLVYPRSTAWVAGDLDLRSLRVFAEGKDLRFEASLRNPVRSPATVMSPGMGTQSLSAFARHGFYAFNIDIYIDTDRAPGSGNTVTLPGRRAQLDPAHAWEKAVVLTPRPELMQRELIAALREISSAGEAEVAATVQRSVFFPTQIRVQGRTVSFIVPGTFIDAAGLAGASVTAFVTAAPLAIDAGIKMSFGDTGAVRDRFALGVAQPDVGEPELTMGHRAAPAPATAVIDLLSPNPNQQALQLASGGRLTGLSRENRMGADPLPLPAQAATAPAAATSDSWFSRALQSMSAVFGGSAATPAPAAAAAPAGTQSVQSLMSPPPAPPVSAVSPAPTAAAAVAPPTAAPVAPVAPAAPAATAKVEAAAAPPPAPRPAPTPTPAATPAAGIAGVAPAATAAAAVPAPASKPAAAAPPAAVPTPQRPRDAAFFEEQENRLRTLKRLRDGGLISEQEYQAKRREVLDQL